MIRGGVKGSSCEGGTLDLVDLVDLVNLFDSAEIYKNTRRNNETIGAACGRTPVVGFLILIMFLYMSAEFNKFTKSTKSTKSQLPPSQLPPFCPYPNDIVRRVRANYFHFTWEPGRKGVQKR